MSIRLLGIYSNTVTTDKEIILVTEVFGVGPMNVHVLYAFMVVFVGHIVVPIIIIKLCVFIGSH